MAFPSCADCRGWHDLRDLLLPTTGYPRHGNPAEEQNSVRYHNENEHWVFVSLIQTDLDLQIKWIFDWFSWKSSVFDENSMLFMKIDRKSIWFEGPDQFGSNWRIFIFHYGTSHKIRMEACQAKRSPRCAPEQQTPAVCSQRWRMRSRGCGANRQPCCLSANPTWPNRVRSGEALKW